MMVLITFQFPMQRIFFCHMFYHLMFLHKYHLGERNSFFYWVFLVYFDGEPKIWNVFI